MSGYKESSLAERLDMLAVHIKGNADAQNLLASIRQDISFVSIDGRQDSQSMWREPQMAYLTSQRLPQVTIQYRNMRYTIEGPIVVAMELQEQR